MSLLFSFRAWYEVHKYNMHYTTEALKEGALKKQDHSNNRINQEHCCTKPQTGGNEMIFKETEHSKFAVMSFLHREETMLSLLALITRQREQVQIKSECMQPSVKTETKQRRQKEKKLTCERILWEVQWDTEQMGNRDENTTKHKEDNEKREMNNGNGKGCADCPRLTLTERSRLWLLYRVLNQLGVRGWNGQFAHNLKSLGFHFWKLCSQFDSCRLTGTSLSGKDSALGTEDANGEPFLQKQLGNEAQMEAWNRGEHQLQLKIYSWFHQLTEK